MEAYYPILVALMFNGLDFLTGFVSAIKNKTLESSRMRDGLFKKVGFVFCYALAVMMDKEGSLIGLQLPFQITPVIVCYVVTTEIISIIENICQINPDLLPEKLKELFNIKEV